MVFLSRSSSSFRQFLLLMHNIHYYSNLIEAECPIVSVSHLHLLGRRLLLLVERWHYGK